MRFATHIGDPHGNPQTSPQHADPHGLGAFLRKSIQEIHVDRHVMGWSAGRHVDHPCGDKFRHVLLEKSLNKGEACTIDCPANSQRCVGDFCCINFGGSWWGFPEHSYLSKFPNKMRKKKLAAKSVIRPAPQKEKILNINPARSLPQAIVIFESYAKSGIGGIGGQLFCEEQILQKLHSKMQEALFALRQHTIVSKKLWFPLLYLQIKITPLTYL